MLSRQTILLLAKFLVSTALIYFLLTNVGWDNIIEDLKNVNKSLLALGMAIVVLQFPLSTWKWQLSLKQHDIHFGFLYLQLVSCIGYFLNNFLPSGIGGDAYRVLRTLPETGPKSAAISATLCDRALGLLSLLVMGYLGALYLYLVEEKTNALLAVAVPLASAGIILIVPAFLIGLKIGFLKKLENLPKIGSKLSPITENLRLVIKPSANLFFWLVLSFVFQFSAIVLLVVLFEAAGAPISIAHSAVIVAVGGVVVMLPISIAGIGVYEGALVGAAVALGLEATPAVLASVSLRLLTIPASVVCGLIFMGSSLRPDKNEQAEALQSTTKG